MREPNWSRDEIQFLLKAYGRMKTKDIAKRLNRTINSVYLQIARQKKEGGVGMKYSSERVSDMMNKCGISNKEMSRRTGLQEDIIVAIRKGKRPLRVLEAIEFSNVLRCSICDFGTTTQDYSI